MSNIIRKARLSAEISQEELAQRIGKTIPTLKKYEENIDGIKVGTLFEICNALPRYERQMIWDYIESRK